MTLDMPRSIELHCHLDGSVRPSTIAALAKQQGIELAGPVEKLAQVAPDCTDLLEYIKAIDIALAVLQTPDALYRAARELVEDWQADGIVHGEARFAPMQHRRKGLGLTEIIDAVADGLRDGSAATGVSSSLILGCMRPAEPSDTWQVVEAAVASPDVVGLDMTGPEAGYLLLPHASAIQAGKAAGLRVTAHAGEADGPRSVWHAIDDLGAERIGHGVRSIEDSDLVSRLAEDGIPLELCPTSNVQTRAVASLREHPINKFRSAGVPVTVSCDSRTVSGVTLRDQFAIVTTEFGWTRAEWNAAQGIAADAAFIDASVRAAIRGQLEE